MALLYSKESKPKIHEFVIYALLSSGSGTSHLAVLEVLYPAQIPVTTLFLAEVSSMIYPADTPILRFQSRIFLARFKVSKASIKRCTLLGY